DVDLHTDQFIGEIIEQFNSPVRGAVLDGDRLTVDPAQIAETSEKGCALRRGCFAQRREEQVPETGHLCGLLRIGNKRYAGNAPPHHGDERSPVHYSMTEVVHTPPEF